MSRSGSRLVFRLYDVPSLLFPGRAHYKEDPAENNSWSGFKWSEEAALKVEKLQKS